MKGNPITKDVWLDATKHSNQLFLEAHRLDALAYELLDNRNIDEHTFQNFQIAKDKASRKYAEAKAAWEEVKSTINSRLPISQM
ncbi:hypothetical protein [Pseudomonas protegens]|uniref:hypothetical protein n=1 Tax=Pseudomonas protegens TaxID=380021 RepID=UPI001F3F0B9B|nr:hypothetical protein [Pseudomonas protegens]